MKKNHHTSNPPIHIFLKVQQNNVTQKITYFLKIYDCENEKIAQSEKLSYIFPRQIQILECRRHAIIGLLSEAKTSI